MVRPAHPSGYVDSTRTAARDSGLLPVFADTKVIHEKAQAARWGQARATTPTVLIVDSDFKARLALRGELHAAGFAVTACDSRRSANTTLRDHRFDLVIVDLVLHDGTGIELVRELRSMPATAGIPVILLASDSRVRERARGLDLSDDEILQKPFPSLELAKRAQRLLHLPISQVSSTHPDAPRPQTQSAHTREQRMPASWRPAGHAPGNAVWCNRDDVPPGSLLHRTIIASGIAAVIGPMTVARACKRAGVDVGASSPSILKRALPALSETLRLFLRDAETDIHIRKMAALLQAAA